MAQRYDAAYAQDILARWCAIAEQRLDHLTELYESGRWRRYHSENAFMENIREAKTAVETWRTLARREATPDNVAVDWSWLDRPAAASPLPQDPIEQPSARLLGTAAVHAALASIMATQEEEAVAVETAEDTSDGEAIASESEFADEAGEMVPDNRTVQERYPVLHIAL